MHRPTALERAYRLAATGEHANCSAVVKALSREGYDTQQIEGAALRRTLTALCREAQGKPAIPGHQVRSPADPPAA